MNLTPKIPCAFLPNYAIFDIVGEIIFSKSKVQELDKVTVGTLSYINLKKITVPNSTRSMKL
jgi:hypothetical protein